MRIVDAADVLRGAGITVVEVPGWQGRGRELDAFRGIMWHHTATPAAVSTSSVIRVARDGRADLPGPLYQTLVDRAGVWHLVADGRANHAGVGEWKGLAGNPDTVAVSMIHVGTSSERWDGRQLSSARVGTAALARRYDVPAAMVPGHKEWAPRRKIDPYGLHMPNERLTIAALLEEDDMTPAQEAKLDQAIGLLGWLKDRTLKTNMAVGRMEQTHGPGLAGLTGGGKVDPAVVAASLLEIGDDLARAVADELARRLGD